MIALAAVQLNQELYVCRMWDLESGTEIESCDLDRPNIPVSYAGREWRLAVAGYLRKRPVTDLAATDTPYGPLAAVGGRASAIPVWSLASQEHVAELLVKGASKPSILAFAPGYLFAGGDYGELLGWRLAAWWPAGRDQPVVSRARRPARGYRIESADVRIPQAHYGPVQALAGGTWNGRPCAVTGGRDGRLHSWTVQGEHLATIDIGEPVTALVNAGQGRYAAGTKRGLVIIENG